MGGSLPLAPPGVLVYPQRLQRTCRSTDLLYNQSTLHARRPLQQVVQVERQNERSLAYGALAVLLGGAGLALLAVPQRCVEFLWAATPSVLVAGITRNFGSVLLLAAICAHCLKVGASGGWAPGGSGGWHAELAMWSGGGVLLPVAADPLEHGPSFPLYLVLAVEGDADDPSPPATLCPLQEAAEHARMQSETYLRLNLGLLWWGLGSAVALWLAPAQPLRMGQG